MGINDMKNQPPADGIMMNYEYSDLKSFRVQCVCSNPDDRIDVTVEADKYGEIVVCFEVEAKTKWWKTLAPWDSYKIDNPILYFFANSVKELINGLHQRITITKDVWINGYVEYQTTVILSKQRALNFSETLKDAIEHLENKDDK